MAPDTPNAFDAAKKIADALTGLPPEEQARALRWAAESVGVSFERSSPTRGTGPAPATPSAPTQPAPPQHDRSKDIKSFVQEKQPKSDNQYAAVVAYYYKFEAPEDSRADHITAKMLEDSTRLVDWKRLAAPRVTLSNATAQGYLDRAGRGEYKLNTVGENLVAMTLPGGGEGDAPSIKRRRRRAAGKAKATKKARSKNSKSKTRSTKKAARKTR